MTQAEYRLADGRIDPSNAPLSTAAKLTLVLVASFVTLVPGGPVETRDFTALGRPAFWGFNVFLIGLGVLAVASSIAILRGYRTAAWGVIACAWGYIFVVLLDLGHVFPTSPDPIPLLLGLVEILDVILAGYVIALAHRALGHF